MGRPLRVDVGGYVYHVLNRASARVAMFESPLDYQQFEQVLEEAQMRSGMRILAYCLMPNHWHLVLWPDADGTLSRFMAWLALTHTQRWHARRGSAGSGHLYQGKGVRNLFGRRAMCYADAMGRPLRVDVGGFVYHVLNRASARAAMFEGPVDYQQFEQVLQEAQVRSGMRILAYCLMPNHWHLVLWPDADGTLSRFTAWLALTHTQRWHARRGSAGSGHLYQGRYKAFLVEADDHLLSVCRYVERNPLRARLVRRAEAWRWGSLWRRERGRGLELLSAWPITRPENWPQFVNRAETPAELEALRAAAQRGRPFGAGRWFEDVMRRFDLGSTLRPRGRPKREIGP